MKFKEEFRWYMRKREEFQDNFFKVFALIWETYCLLELRRAIKELPKYDSGVAKIRDNPLKLLEVIENLMHTPEKAKYLDLRLSRFGIGFLKPGRVKRKNYLITCHHSRLSVTSSIG